MSLYLKKKNILVIFSDASENVYEDTVHIQVYERKITYNLGSIDNNSTYAQNMVVLLAAFVCSLLLYSGSKLVDEAFRKTACGKIFVGILLVIQFR